MEHNLLILIINHLKNKQLLHRKLTQPEDKVEISAKAKEPQKGPDLMKERQEKIAQLKATVENGTYKVDGKGIAEKMVNFYKQQ